MKKIIIFILMMSFLVPPTLWAKPVLSVSEKPLVGTDIPSTYSLTLSDCYKLALKQSEIIAVDASKIQETEAHFLQALSIMLPHVSFVSTDMQQQEQAGSGSLISAPNPSTSSERKFNVKQTLFNGFKAFAAMKGSRSEKGQRVNDKLRAEQLLLVDVSDAFYLLIEKKNDLRSLGMIRNALMDRVRELKARADLGRSRASEVVNAQAALYQVEAEIRLARNQEVIARQLLEFLVGRPVRSVVDTYRVPLPLSEETFYLAKVLQRPDVKAAKFTWDMAQSNVVFVDSGFLPEVTLDSNYYTMRSGYNKGIDWDVMLKVNVPIFEGTETLGASKAANLQARQSQLLFQRSKRSGYHDIRDAYKNLTTAIAMQSAIEKVFFASKINYRLQKKDYEYNLVNNLDVLDAIKLLHDSQRNYIHAFYETKRLYWQLLVSTGESL